MAQATDATDLLLKSAENRIQSVLLSLDEDLIEAGLKIDGLSVDTRQWGNLKCEVLVRSRI